MDLLDDVTENAKGSSLADAVRPRSLDEVVGQKHLLEEGAPFRTALENGVLGSFLLWGPPGSGKTTLVLLVANYTRQRFVRFSAVTGGVGQVREIVKEARGFLSSGRGTLLFVDEIHRFNKAQQDAFLPHVEDGTITLAGATTENPSFEINAPLLSRCSVYTLKRLSREQLLQLLERAVSHSSFRELHSGSIQEEVLDMIAEVSDGDGRRALNSLE
ncbi:MAG: AAA family ATPase, partial [Candidatus Aegiribacteria sp.]|nr:AAA family ATPase [Candidatus Aegiribacteria sp.]MBD3294510.1 AAA family ATPase [Candidatus Fermentibacteria bacterium]